MPQASYADIYSTCLYVTGEGLPLWNPSPLRLGDIGFVRHGTFHTLFNCIDGPPVSLSNAASIELATRSDGSRSRSDSLVTVAGQASEGEIDVDTDPTAATASDASPEGRGLRRSPRLAAGVLSPLSPPASVSSLRPSPRPTRSATPPEGPHPPLPLEVDQETPKVFDMGPRMSYNYRCLGFSAGASVAGAPLSGKITFETSGGDGAILVPRDPTERTILKHMGVLKAYVKTHRRWIHDTYGRIEDIDLDELALIYGQDRTSDWGVGVSKDSSRGARVEFEILSAGQTGFWGSWSHSLSASQRGPHRPVPPMVGAQLFPTVPAPSMRAGDGGKEIGVQTRFGDAGEVGFTLKKGGKDGEGAERTSRPGFQWLPGNRLATDQSIIIRRVTARTSLGLGFLPTRLKAAAEPKDPERGRRNGDNDDDDDDEGGPAAAPASSSGACCRQGLVDDVKAAAASWSGDPLEALHRWMHQEDARVQVSIASDDDCLRLLSLLASGSLEALDGIGLAEAVRLAASRYAWVKTDEEGFATIEVEAGSLVCRARARQTWAPRHGVERCQRFRSMPRATRPAPPRPPVALIRLPLSLSLPVSWPNPQAHVASTDEGASSKRLPRRRLGAARLDDPMPGALSRSLGGAALLC
ncbi:hypothetical protein ACQY0O_000918 [Thecaphora frezii]